MTKIPISLDLKRNLRYAIITINEYKALVRLQLHLLEKFSPKPLEITRNEALQIPPRIIVMTTSLVPWLNMYYDYTDISFDTHTVGDVSRVVLKGDLQNYIHAVYVHVWTPLTMCCTVLLTGCCAGIQATESIHHSSESHGVHSQRFLEDGP